MTHIVNITDPDLVVVDHGTSVRVIFAGGDELLVTTAAEGKAAGYALLRAAWICEQAEMLRGARKDRVAAAEVNEAFEQANSDWPGGTLAPAFTQRHIVHIPVTEGDVA